MRLDLSCLGIRIWFLSFRSSSTWRSSCKFSDILSIKYITTNLGGIVLDILTWIQFPPLAFDPHFIIQHVPIPILFLGMQMDISKWWYYPWLQGGICYWWYVRLTDTLFRLVLFLTKTFKYWVMCGLHSGLISALAVRARIWLKSIERPWSSPISLVPDMYFWICIFYCSILTSISVQFSVPDPIILPLRLVIPPHHLTTFVGPYLADMRLDVTFLFRKLQLTKITSSCMVSRCTADP